MHGKILLRESLGAMPAIKSRMDQAAIWFGFFPNRLCIANVVWLQLAFDMKREADPSAKRTGTSWTRAGSPRKNAMS
jgi:hypothetical protein